MEVVERERDVSFIQNLHWKRISHIFWINLTFVLIFDTTVGSW